MSKLTFAVCLLLAAPCQAQRYAARGSTPQGDVLRGQGQFLRGAGWYELNNAKANAINAQAEIEMQKWNQQVYDDYMRDRSARLQARRNQTKAQAELARKKYAEQELRYRTDPTMDDIVKGAALNALLIDLSNPSISTSSWRLAQVPLPPDLGIPSLVFRFAPKPGENQALAKGVIALARLDTIKGRPWGTVLLMDELSAARKAYEDAYAKVRDECLTGKLTLNSPLKLLEAIQALKDKVAMVVPSTNGYRTVAMRDVQGLNEAARIFHAETIDYAREMIADTQTHEAKTVGELLAFMRKYRLLFATSERTLGGGELYGRLYGLMREQKEKLGGDQPKVAEAKPEAKPEVAKVVPQGNSPINDLEVAKQLLQAISLSPATKAVKGPAIEKMIAEVDQAIAQLQQNPRLRNLPNLSPMNVRQMREKIGGLSRGNAGKLKSAIAAIEEAQRQLRLR